MQINEEGRFISALSLCLPDGISANESCEGGTGRKYATKMQDEIVFFAKLMAYACICHFLFVLSALPLETWVPAELTFAKLSELQINQKKSFIYASIMNFFTNLFGNSIFLL